MDNFTVEPGIPFGPCGAHLVPNSQTSKWAQIVQRLEGSGQLAQYFATSFGEMSFPHLFNDKLMQYILHFSCDGYMVAAWEVFGHLGLRRDGRIIVAHRATPASATTLPARRLPAIRSATNRPRREREALLGPVTARL